MKLLLTRKILMILQKLMSTKNYDSILYTAKVMSILRIV